MKFKIDDKVIVVADEKRLSRICNDTTLTGKTGVVKQYDTEYTTLPWLIDLGSRSLWLAEQDIELVESERTFVGHPNGMLEVKNADTTRIDKGAMTVFSDDIDELSSVSHEDYMSLSDAYDTHSRELMNLKGDEYAIDGDFLAMENRLAGMLGDTPEYVSLVMAGKHITALGIILEKNDVDKIKLVKLDERVRDACNLIKIAAAFVHAKQNDFSLHLGKEEEADHVAG